MEVSPRQRVFISSAALAFAAGALAIETPESPTVMEPRVYAEGAVTPLDTYSAVDEMRDQHQALERARLAEQQREAAAQAKARAEAQAKAERERELAQERASRSRHTYVPKEHHTQVTSNMADDLRRLRQCESGGDYQANTGNGYYGAYQFDMQTWIGAGFKRFAARPDLASPGEQDEAVIIVHAARGWQPWPVCGKKL